MGRSGQSSRFSNIAYIKDLEINVFSAADYLGKSHGKQYFLVIAPITKKPRKGLNHNIHFKV